MKPINFLLPEDLARQLGAQARSRRLAVDWSRRTLAERSGVPESTIRKFETTGMLGLTGVLQLADALGCMDDFAALFAPKVPLTIDAFLAPPRQRGRK